MAAYRQRPEAKARKRDRQYGLSVGEYDEMMLHQDGVCAVCGQECSTGRRLAVDHDHATGAVRGLLCNNCNFGIGQLQDDPDLLRTAADYLEAHVSEAS